MKKDEKQGVKTILKHANGAKILLVIYDALVVNAAYFLALWFRFDCRINLIRGRYLYTWKKFTPYYTVICILVFALFRLYRSIWRFASYSELYRVVLASAATAALHTVFITLIYRMPLSYYTLGAILQFMGIAIPRFGYRFLLLLMDTRRNNTDAYKRVMIIGGGEAGRIILRDIRHAKEIHEKAVCVIDDDPKKRGMYVEGVPIAGDRHGIFKAVVNYNVDKIYLAIPSISAEDRRDIINICNETGCEIKQLPGIYQMINGDISIKDMKDVSLEDLLGREPVKADLKEVMEMIHGKVVLVTGGGGSIGSELCRQIAANDPKQLIIFDIYENNAYDIQLELREKYPDLNLTVLIGSVRDSRKIFQVFEKYHPQLVYHAAAHKHVPLMEDSPCEAIKNNAIGTYKTAYAAMAHGCERFVLISTDKAVRPTNIMGASKRLCEMIIQCFDMKIKEGKASEIPQLFTHMTQKSIDQDGTGRVYFEAKTEFVAVRFGNVLGSNGSVIPIFRKQIEKGGPVTVTHPDIIRYFMTIPEAASLVLTAGTYAKGGEIFVLDMGSPVKIADLAKNLIQLSGFKPDVDIKIEYTGLRPGEKLYEEKLMSEEGLEKTKNQLIHIGKPIPFDMDEFFRNLEMLMNAAYRNDPNIRKIVVSMVNTYHPEESAYVARQDETYRTLVGKEA